MLAAEATGWCCAWIARLDGARDSWTAPVDSPRVPPGEDLRSATAAQIRALTGRLDIGGAAPLFVFDAGYDPIALTVDLADLPVAVLAGIRGDRVFYTDPATGPPVSWAGRAGTARGSAAPTRPAGRPRSSP